MYAREFEFKILNSRQVPNFWLFFGDEKFSVEYYAGEFAARFESDNVKKLYFEEWRLDEALSHLEGGGLFGGMSVLRAKFDAKPRFKELKKVVAKCHKNPENVFICEVYAALSAREINDGVADAFGANFLRVFAPKDEREMLALLQLAAKKQRVQADPAALKQIYALQNGDVFLSVAELNKVAKLRGVIDERGVEELVFPQGVISFEQFFDALVRGEMSARMVAFLEEVLQSPRGAVGFFKWLFGEFYRLFSIFVAMQIRADFSLKSVLGYEPPQQVGARLLGHARLFNAGDFRRIFAFLNEAELALKEREEGFWGLIMRLKMILSKN